MSLASRLLISASLLGVSCVEPNHGARIIANFQTLGPPAVVTVAGATTPFLTPHYEMWATIRKDVVVDLLAFDVAPVVDPNSPCLLYDSAAEQAYPGEVTAGEPVMAPLPDCTASGAPANCAAIRADKGWLQGRAIALSMAVFAVTSPSDGFASMTNLDLSKCSGNDCWLDDAAILPGTFQLARGSTTLAPGQCMPGMPAPAGHYCLEPSSGRVTLPDTTGTYTATYRAHLRSPAPQTDPAGWNNQDRLRACAMPGQKTINGAANPYYDPQFYIGNLLQLSAPRGGTLYGLVDTLDPNAGLELGGVQVVVPYQLNQASEIFITLEDHFVGSPDKNVENRVDPTNRGPVVLTGTTNFGDVNAGEGVMTADLSAPADITVLGNTPGGHVSIYNNLDDDNLQF